MPHHWMRHAACACIALLALATLPATAKDAPEKPTLTMAVGGLPEEWVRLDEGKQNEIREIIRKLRQMTLSNR